MGVLRWQLRTQHLHSLHTLAICCSAPHPAIPCTLSANADTASGLLTQAPPTRSAAKQPHPPTLKLSRSILSREVYCSARAAASPVCLPPCCAACCASCHAGGAGIPAACAACSAAATAVPASPGSPGKRGMSAAEALELAVAVLLLPPAAPASASAGWTESGAIVAAAEVGVPPLSAIACVCCTCCAGSGAGPLPGSTGSARWSAKMPSSSAMSSSSRQEGTVLSCGQEGRGLEQHRDGR